MSVLMASIDRSAADPLAGARMLLLPAGEKHTNDDQRGGVLPSLQFCRPD